jgi:hypothetical protein
MRGQAEPQSLAELRAFIDFTLRIELWQPLAKAGPNTLRVYKGVSTAPVSMVKPFTDLLLPYSWFDRRRPQHVIKMASERTNYWNPVGPLTTVFTPPASCLQHLYYDPGTTSTIVTLGKFRSQSECYPTKYWEQY